MFGLNKTAEVNPALSFFLDAVIEYSQKKPNSIKDFLTWWDEKKDKLSLIVPAELDAVRIMTIHKSKGLQFPVVIYPFATEKARNTKEWLWAELNEKAIPEMKAGLFRTSKDLEDTDLKELYETETAKSYLDLVNMLYVTLTRAEERIYVLTKMPGKTKEQMKSVPDIFAEYLTGKGEWAENKLIYTTGKEEAYVTKDNSKESGTYSLKQFISNDWRKEIIIRTQAPEYWDADEPDDKREYGKLTHFVLSKIKYTEDVETVLNGMETEGIIEQNDSDKIKQKVKEALLNNELKVFFEHEEGTVIKTEAEIYVSRDGTIHRPDRLIIKDRKCSIIEYKTGKPDDYHIKQLNTYEDILRDAGFDEIEKYLFYIEENKLQLIDKG